MQEIPVKRERGFESVEGDGIAEWYGENPPQRDSDKVDHESDPKEIAVDPR